MVKVEEAAEAAARGESQREVEEEELREVRGMWMEEEAEACSGREALKEEAVVGWWEAEAEEREGWWVWAV
jgi:hypothetical protein